MPRLIGVVWAFVTATLCAAASAQAAPNERSLPMRFELRQEGPAQACGQNCRTLISAAGAITAETPIEFRNFASSRNLRGATLVLDSDGGSVLGAIALGRQIRTLELSTTVGRATDVKTEDRAYVSPIADCESMCAFVLLAGKHRSVPSQARVMVHQIWLGDRREDPTAATYSAEDLVLVQRDIGRLARYTADMGGPAELLELALRIPPWEPMHALTRDELRRMALDTLDNGAPDRAPLETAAIGITAASAMRGLTPGERGWSLVERDGGGSALLRRHPLTVEGDEIGSFDLSLMCGSEADGYVVSYEERRRREAGRDADKLNAVSLRVGSYSAQLKVMSSGQRDATSDLETLASGTVPAALIRAFTASGHHSMTVTTASPSGRTVIRLGNTNAARNLAQLVAACEKTTKRADLPTAKTGGLAQRQ